MPSICNHFLSCKVLHTKIDNLKSRAAFGVSALNAQFFCIVFLLVSYLNYTDFFVVCKHLCEHALDYYSHCGLCVYSYRDLKARVKRDSQIGVTPMLIHFSYRLPSGDYLKEAQRAFSDEQITGKYELYYHPTLKNLAVKKLL